MHFSFFGKSSEEEMIFYIFAESLEGFFDWLIYYMILFNYGEF